MGKNIDQITRTLTTLTGAERMAVRDGSGDAKAVIETALLDYITSGVLDAYIETTLLDYITSGVLDTYINNLIATDRTTQRRGTIQLWGAAAAPTGALLCNGQAVSRTTYAALFAIYGDTFGSGDGSTTFNLPDFSGRSPLGVGTSSGGTDFTHVAETVALATKYNDKMQLIEGQHTGVHSRTSTNKSGVFSGTTKTTGILEQGAFGSVLELNFSSADSPNARTDTTTRGKGLGINFIVWY